MKRLRGIPFLLAVVFILVLSFSALAAPDSIGIVTFVKGEVSLIRDGKPGPLNIDEKILKTDSIEAGPNGKARIVFFGEELNGMKVVSGGEKLEVSKLLSQKPEERSL